MSKRAYITRYLLILKKLKSTSYSSYDELKSYIDQQMEYYDDEFRVGFSKRTLQRDLREIRESFGIEIEYSKSSKGYFISDSKTDNMNFQRMIEAFDMFNSLNIAQDLKPYIHLEERTPQGTEHLHPVLHAIRNRCLITFKYQKFLEEESTQRAVEPFALKEFKSRWYLVGKDIGDGHIKTFAIDRVSELIPTEKDFIYPEDFSVQKLFRDAFGIITSEDNDPEDIILSFTPLEGKYLKSLPLHKSQHILIDNDHEFRISLHLLLTHDLVMELLSFGENMQVIKPLKLVKLIRSAHENAWRKYASAD